MQRWRCSAILYATIIIVLVFLPLFARDGGAAVRAARRGIHRLDVGIAGRFGNGDPGPASFYLLPRMKSLDHGDTRVLAWLKARYRNGLQAVLERPRAAVFAGTVAVIVAAAAALLSDHVSAAPSTKAPC